MIAAAMSDAIILQHVQFETPGRIVPIFRDFGIPIQTRKLYQGDEVPTDLDEIRVLIILGGPMGVSDIGNEKFPFLAKEVELLKRMIAMDRPVLGICLGAQLLAHAQRRTGEALARTTEVERFSTLGAETLNAADPVEALTAIAEVIRATLSVDSCDIYVHRGKEADLELLAHAAAPKAIRSASTVGRASGLLAWVGGRREMAVERKDGTVSVGAAVEDAGAGARSESHSGWFLSWGDIADARAIVIPLTVQGRSVGVLRVANEPHVDLAPGQRAFLNALSYYAALGVERVQLSADASHTAALRDMDRLKNALLAAVSHDLRTPLTTVKALAHAIVERGASPGDSNAISIEEEADRLTSLITDLLDYSRLTGGALQLAPQIESADDLIGALVFRKFRLVLDYRGGRMWLDPSS